MKLPSLLWLGSLVAFLLGPLDLQAGEGRTEKPSLPAEPLFSRHIVPLFSRLGCNAGTCHGTVPGKNGFRLSLFGADPGLDHSRLLREFGGRRLNFTSPEQSLLVLKATGQVPHEGGKRMAVGSPEHTALLGWIAKGAPLDPLDKSRMAGLQVSPRQQTLKPGERYRLQVRATFSDGSQEDVTSLCTFESRDGSVVMVDREGQVQAVGPGGAALLARFRGQPAVSRVVVPAEAKAAFPEVKEHNFIDKQVLDQLRRLNIHPSDVCDDATFLRRATLDVRGALPTPDEIRSFVADQDPTKRAKKIDELLARPGHAALWATKFSDLLRPQFREDNRVWAEAAYQRRFYEWLRARFLENTPYDEFVERILLATSMEGKTKEELLQNLQQMAEEDAARSPHLKAYQERRTLDLYWLRANSNGVQGTIQFAHAFLGLRMQCAQCHRHPTDVWQQDDLLSFANFFNRVGRQREGTVPPAEKAKQAEEIKKLQEQAKKLRDQAKDKSLAKDDADKLLAEAADVDKKAGMMNRFNYLRSSFTHVDHSPKGQFVAIDTPLGKAASKEFRLLASQTPVSLPAEKDPREVVLAWLRQPDNPFFARAIVNRVWAHYFGRGIVDPPDDLSPLNPPTHPELLDELSRGFIESKYDLKWLHRAVLNSRTYQQSAQANASNRADRVNYARFAVRRLPAEVVVDAINHATASAETFPEISHLPAGTKAIEVPGMTNFNRDGSGAMSAASLDYAFQLFGRSKRQVSSQCDCDTGSESSLVQSLYLASYGDVLKKLNAPTGRVARLVKDIPDENQRIEEAFLWVLARFPTAGERQKFQAFLKEAKSPEDGTREILWVLLNAHEFLLNR
ncbi:MAG: DUF1553 domain-containing protein [Planctomycetia bacterium]|nr:DUF1553 domain-containing protein [Planctomycetia bacterium]